ncbi:MAG: SDR family oxidoreductase [Planctomycetaceae bacterium]|nr:SDR family oxidoreductase [Planctomycetaceae bacterium]
MSEPGSPFTLTGRSALITGGSKGIGFAIAAQFARAGADLFLCSRGQERLDQAVGQLREIAPNVKIEATTADMARRDEAGRLAVAAIERLGKVDILVNNAGWNIPQAVDEIKDEDWDYCVELNLSSVMALTRAVVPNMKQRGWGRVIHISSVMGLGSTPKRNVYSATKAALIGMCHASALDLGPHGITVNCIAPGPIATEMPMSILSKEQQDSFSKRTAIGRWGKPEEIAGPALLLASDAGSYMTGATIVVDGGIMANVF